MYAKGNTTIQGAIHAARDALRYNRDIGTVAIYAVEMPSRDGVRYWTLSGSRGLGDDVVCVVVRSLVRAALAADVADFSNV